jgi:hypothetical protein
MALGDLIRFEKINFNLIKYGMHMDLPSEEIVFTNASEMNCAVWNAMRLHVPVGYI